MRLICYEYVNNSVQIYIFGRKKHYISRYDITLCSYSLLSLAINDDENMFRCKYPKICFIYMDTKTWHSDLILELQWNRILMREIELVIYVIQK